MSFRIASVSLVPLDSSNSNLRTPHSGTDTCLCRYSIPLPLTHQIRLSTTRLRALVQISVAISTTGRTALCVFLGARRARHLSVIAFNEGTNARRWGQSPFAKARKPRLCCRHIQSAELLPREASV